MQYAHAYTRLYSDTALKDLKNRHAQWDKRSQYHSVIKGSTGNRMPFYVKFPCVSETFENMLPGNPWAKNRPGKYNGLYYVPDNPHTHGFRVDDVKFGEFAKNFSTVESTSYFNTRCSDVIESYM